MLKNLVLLRSVLDQPVHYGSPREHSARVDVGGVNLKYVKRAVNNLSVRLDEVHQYVFSEHFYDGLHVLVLHENS